MTRPICVFVLFGFFAQIIPPRGMAIWDLYKYTNPDLSQFFLWREGDLPPRGSTSPKTTQLFRLPCCLRLPPAIPFGQFFYRQRSCFPALSPMTSPLPPDFFGLHDFSSEFSVDVDLALILVLISPVSMRVAMIRQRQVRMNMTAFRLIFRLRAMWQADVVGAIDSAGVRVDRIDKSLTEYRRNPHLVHSVKKI